MLFIPPSIVIAINLVLVIAQGVHGFILYRGKPTKFQDKIPLVRLHDGDQLPFRFYCDIQYPGHQWNDLKQVEIFALKLALQLSSMMESPKKRSCSIVEGSTLCDVIMHTDDNRPFHVQAFVDPRYYIKNIYSIYNVVVSQFQYRINPTASTDCM